MPTPYDSLEARNYWRTAVADHGAVSMLDLYRPKFEIGQQTRLATAGSCFAQNLRRAIKDRNYSVVDTEPAPPGLGAVEAARFGFGTFSARFGNIYTVRQLRELLAEAYGAKAEVPIWERNGRHFDALRPAVEPTGHATPSLVLLHREQHLERVRQMIDETDVFVFTLGLTEAWIDKQTGRVVPSAPGVIAGSYDADATLFVNFGPKEVADDLEAVRHLLRERKPDMRLLLTVSPVPLTATASNQHVLVATGFSKSVLRGAAGHFAHQYEDVDYFPAYEIITNCYSGVRLYEANLRSVSASGVATVMNTFFESIEGSEKNQGPSVVSSFCAAEQAGDVACEESLLDAFAP